MTSRSAPLSTTAQRPSWWRRRCFALAEILRHMKRRWYLYLPILAVWGFAYARLFVDPTPRTPVLFNWTPSLPYHVAVVQYGRQTVRRGDLVVFAFAGKAQQHYPGLRNQPFFKRIRGLPGDEVSVEGREVFVNGEAVGLAKTHAFDRHPLSPIEPVVIPAGHYYVQGTSADSFDSRYHESGLVHEDQLLAVVVPLF